MQEAVLPYKTWQQMPRITKPTTSNSTPSSSTSVIFHLQEGGSAAGVDGAGDLIIMMIKNMVKENPVIVFGKKGCCMSHVIKRLLQGLGVNPPVYEIEEKDEEQIIDVLKKQIILSTPAAAAAGGGGGDVGSDRTRSPTPVLQFPAVFIGGELFGGLDRIMAAHITGELTPVLKKAGALWL